MGDPARCYVELRGGEKRGIAPSTWFDFSHHGSLETGQRLLSRYTVNKVFHELS